MADIYKIAVRIALTNGMSPVLAIISRDLLGIHAKVGQIEKSFGRWATAIGGVGAVMAGSGIVTGLMKVASHGSNLLDQQDKLLRANVSLNEVLRLQRNYYDNVARSVPTSTASDYLKTFNELRSVVGPNMAETITPWSLQVESLIANASGKHAAGEGFKLWRALEMTGRSISDPIGTQKLADAFVKNIVASGGKLDAQIYQTMAKRGGVAWANASPAFLAGPMSVVAADLGGDTAGTALMSAYMFLTGTNTMSKQQAAIMEKAGLLNMSKVTRTGFGGGTLQVAPGGIVGSDKYMGAGHFDLYGWTHDVLEPHLMKLAHGNRAVFDSLIAKVGRNRNVMRMLTMFSDPGFVAQIDKDLQLWGQAHNVAQSYSDAIGRNPKFVSLAFDKQREAMMEAVGAPMMQAAMPIMNSLTALFEQLGAIANAHPETIRVVAEALAALAASLVVVGLVALGTALVALVGTGGILVAVAGGLAALAALNWPSIKQMLGGPDQTGKPAYAVPTPLPNDSPGGAAFDRPTGPYLHGRQSWNVIPPAAQITVKPANVSINLDNRKIGEAQIAFLARLGAGPAEGSAYHDSTYSTAPMDLSLV
jgi:hypothetical protein